MFLVCISCSALASHIRYIIIMHSSKIILCSVRGLQGKVMQRKVYYLLEREQGDVALLQESHLEDYKHLKLLSLRT